MKKFLIAGNWKMNKTGAEAAAFAEELKAKNLPNAKDVCVMAPFTAIDKLGKALEGSGIGFGAQNVHFEPKGAFTGEISVEMLQELGVGYCVIGHSERREYFAETDETVNKKLKVLIEAGITPILCVGESLEIREQGGEQAFVAGQVVADFAGIPAADNSGHNPAADILPDKAADRTAVQEPDRSAERGRNYRRTAADRSRRCYCYYRGVRP